MSILHAVILGVVQGLTEFLPISSSGHLVLVPEILGWSDLSSDNDRAFDVALHMGTLIAAVSYFRSDLARYFRAGIRSLRTRSLPDADSRVAWLLVIATVPAVVVGGLFGGFIDDHLTGPVVVSVMLIGFGVLLGLADRLSERKTIGDAKTKEGWALGSAQAVALIPGTSRSGITMTAGRMLGFDRDSAARISFLMLIPATLAAGVYTGGRLAADGFPSDATGAFIAGVVTSAVTGYMAIWWLLRYLRTRSFMPFVIYRVALGCGILIWLGVR